jgi:hypothetical protein
MKKILLFIIANIVLSQIVFAEVADTHVVANGEATVSISPTMQIISQSQHREDAKLGYEIDTKYPQIQGKTLSAGAKEFNSAIKKIVTTEVDQFKRLVALDKPHMQTLPEDIRTNSMKADYDVDVVKPKSGTIISVRMTFEGMQAGRAHPYHNNHVINFDLQTGKILTLSDLFKKDANFLKALAAYASNALNHKLKHDNWMVPQGTKADMNNFKNWNLQADSILITFDEYQVAPYTYGSQEVEIPYNQLKKILSAKAPIADCVGDSKSCEVA